MKSNPLRTRAHPLVPAVPAALSAIVAAALLAACAGAPSGTPPVRVAVVAPAPAAAASGVATRQVCRHERPIGSSMAQLVCHNVDDSGKVADTVDDLDRQMNGGNTAMLGRAGMGH